MAPKPQEDPMASALEAGKKLAHPEPGDEVVISGIAGVFPNTDNVMDFAENLFNKVDLISDDDRRWKMDHPEIPQRTGKLNNITKFDAAFFGIHYKQANTMDPMCRILLEKTYEAVVDSGYSPRTMYGSRTGVFIGACFSESEKTWLYEKLQVNGFGITGCSRAMLANRISYWLGANGPSYTVDSACSSSIYALEHGYRAIRDGECDAAIVGGCNLCLHPYVSLQFARLGVLSLDGKCKSFDEGANGYCRSEAVSVIFLQKKKDARRIYATLVHVKTNCDGYKDQGITYPSGAQQQVLLEDFYNECELDPSTLAWVEAHGTGTKVGDPEEVKALENVFCKNRKEALKIGSIKSNIGHTEPASGVCSITKVVIAMETGFIPPNINFTTPKQDIESFHNGKITVITEKTPWEGGLVGVNSFGFGGANGHALLKWNEKAKINNGLPEDDLPRLVSVSGRTEEAVNTILTYLETNTIDAELVKLFHEIHKQEIPGHQYRGYTILSKNKKSIRNIKFFSGKQREVWFVFSGLGSEWPGMGSSLMIFPIFAAAIEKCHRILRSYNVDLNSIITKTSVDLQKNPLYCVVGITAIQIALVDLLKSIGFYPDGFIGQSFGEIGCAYVDGTLSAEEAILVSYHMGSIFENTGHINGSMALIGANKEDLLNLCPFDVEIVSHFGRNCLISGSEKSVKTVINSLKDKNCFVKILSAKSACHSSLIRSVGSLLNSNLRKVIMKPKSRSHKWISTSILKDNIRIQNNKEANIEYFCNNIISPIYLDEAIQQVPHDAIIIEIAPDSLLQSFLQDSVDEAIHFDLMSKNSSDNCLYLLSSIGKLTEYGVNVSLDKLYPEIQYPVSRSTPMIAPLIKWEHSEDWYVTTYKMQDKVKSGERTVSVSLKDREFLSGHVIDGRVLFPATGYLDLVWQTLGLMRGDIYTEIPVVFENVRFLRATNITKEGTVDFVVMVQKVSGHFEIMEGGSVVVTGRVYVPHDIDKEMSDLDPTMIAKSNEDERELTKKDIYKELHLRGYQYKDAFQSLVCATTSGSHGKIQWHNNWVAFMDNALQILILQIDTRALYLPTGIEKMAIDVKKHARLVDSLLDDNKEIPVYANKDLNLLVAGGFQIRGLLSSCIPRRKPLCDPVVERHLFIQHESKNEILSVNNILRMYTQFILENEPSLKVKVIELADSFINADGPLFAPIIAQTLGDIPLVQADISILSPPNNPLLEDISSDIIVEDKKIVCDQSALIVTASDLLGTPQSEKLKNCLGAIKECGYIITREKPNFEVNCDGVTKCLEYSCNGETIVLLKKDKKEKGNIEVVNITSKNFTWLEKLKTALKAEDIKRVYLVSQNEKYSGILGLINCIRKESDGEKVRAIFIMDTNAPEFSLDDPLYATQVAKDLVTNVYKGGEWGGYFHLPIEDTQGSNVLHAFINVTTRGDLSSLNWIEGPITKSQIKSDEKTRYVTVCYSSLNFRDIMTATGKIPAELVADSRLNQECVQGLEFAGIDTNGKRVMGILSHGSLSSIIAADSELMWEIPDHWTLEDAVTIPIVYSTIVYSLVHHGKIMRGESILIHAGSGGVGLAAIHFALYFDCKIYTTVGTQEKREFIKKLFPQLTDNQIGNSRDTSFEQLIMRETNGHGVDIVLNSLAEEKLLASVRCLAPGGRFLEIGKFDLGRNTQLGMDMFTKQQSYQGIMLDKIFRTSQLEKRDLKALMDRFLYTDAVVPLPRKTFDSDDVEQAFRYMAAGKHIGKVLVKVRDEQTNPNNLEVFTKPVIPRFYCKPEKSYIIIGGLGGFGLELADWLVLRGAKVLVLSSRTGLKNGYQSMRINIWKSYGVTVQISTVDVTTEHGVLALLEEANSLGPVGGIFNLAVVLRDALLENQTESDFEISFGPKAIATQYLDIHTRTLCPELEKFVVFSSVSCGRGNLGQTNYGMANSIMERICEARVAEGLPGLAIQWGAVGDVGLVAEKLEGRSEIVIGGTLQQQISSCLKLMDVFMNQKHEVVSSMVVAEKKIGKGASESIVDTVANILGLRDLKTISLHSTLAELGMDSMMAVEIKQALEREFDVFLTPQDIRGMTFAKLNEYAISDTSTKKITETKKDENVKTTINFLLRIIGEEQDSSDPIVRLHSKCKPNDGEFLNACNPVFVFPGMEGQASALNILAKNLNFPVLGVQYDYTKSNESIEDVALAILPHIKKHLMPGELFNIVGYSFGGIVAIEVVRYLEQDGFKGNLCLLDSSPEFINAAITEFFSMESEEQFQMQLLLRCVELIWPEKTALKSIETELKEMKTWESKVDLLVDTSPFNEKYSNEYQKLIIYALYNRIKAGLKYKGPHNQDISSQMILIRPTDTTVTTETDDYGLQKITKNDMKLHFIEGNHWTFLENIATADIINEMVNLNKTIDFKQTFISSTPERYDSDFGVKHM